jgi:hypothetical protein
MLVGETLVHIESLCTVVGRVRVGLEFGEGAEISGVRSPANDIRNRKTFQARRLPTPILVENDVTS